MSFISLITYRDKPTHHIKTTLRNEGSYILVYGDINYFNKIDVINTYDYKDEHSKYRIKTSGFYVNADVNKYIKKYGEENILYTKDGRFRGIKVRKDYEMYHKKGQSNIWTDLQQNNIHYPTQKPYKLLKRIIMLSTI